MPRDSFAVFRLCKSCAKPVVASCVDSAAILSYWLAKATRRKPSLTTIANYHACDKGTLHGYGRLPYRGHGYTHSYQKLFEGMRDKEISILEIGIGVEGPGALGTTVFGRNSGGASLKTWHEYFDRAKIYGIDLNPATFLDNDRIRTLVADQGDRDALQAAAQAIGGDLDLVIDDGSHASRHQQPTLALFFRHLSPGGLYLVEDLQFQPPSIEEAGDLKTFELIEKFVTSGDLSSPHLSKDDADYLVRDIASCEFIRDRHGRADVAVLRKRPSRVDGEVP